MHKYGSAEQQVAYAFRQTLAVTFATTNIGEVEADAKLRRDKFQLSRDFRRSEMQRVVGADKGRRFLRKARLKHRAKFSFHIRRLRLNHDVGCCNIRSQLVIERGSFAARENAFRLPAPKHGPHLMARERPVATRLAFTATSRNSAESNSCT